VYRDPVAGGVLVIKPQRIAGYSSLVRGHRSGGQHSGFPLNSSSSSYSFSASVSFYNLVLYTIRLTQVKGRDLGRQGRVRLKNKTNVKALSMLQTLRD